MDLGVRADLLRVPYRRCTARWTYLAEHPALNQHAAMGWLPDGRWWADVDTHGAGGRLFPPGEDASARAYCEAMMTRHGPRERWAEVWPEHVPGVAPGRRQDPPPYPPGDPRGSLSGPPGPAGQAEG